MTRGTVRFAHSGLTGARISDEGLPVECYPIDDLFGDASLTFIKMDIEGAEFDALKGASKVIQRSPDSRHLRLSHAKRSLAYTPLHPWRLTETQTISASL